MAPSINGRNPWRARPDFRWAHQGGAREGPSNTLYAMRRAMETGAQGLELDVHATRDRVLVCAHDAKLRRMTGQRGRICKLSFDQLHAYDAAARWVPGQVDVQQLQDGQRYELAGRAAGDDSLRIPSLQSVLNEFPGVPLTLELKGRQCEALLATLLATNGRDNGDTIVVSFWPSRLRRFRKLGSGAATAAPISAALLFWLFSRVWIAWRTSGHVALQMRARLGPYWFVDRRYLRAAHRRDLAVHAWTVDEPRHMHRLMSIGVDGIMTDRPSELMAVADELSTASPVT